MCIRDSDNIGHLFEEFEEKVDDKRGRNECQRGLQKQCPQVHSVQPLIDVHLPHRRKHHSRSLPAKLWHDIATALHQLDAICVFGRIIIAISAQEFHAIGRVIGIGVAELARSAVDRGGKKAALRI